MKFDEYIYYKHLIRDKIFNGDIDKMEQWLEIFKYAVST